MMPKKKRLNGLPYDLIKSYFATDKYCDCGYMADWMLNTAKRLNIDEIIIDIINQTYFPGELNFHPFTYELPFLKAIIERNLSHNGFNKDFIIEAKIKVEFHKEPKALICHAWLIDRESNKYSVGPMTELSYGEEFDPLQARVSLRVPD